MTVDTIISNLKTSISGLSSVNVVRAGLDMPDDVGTERYPAVFIFGGQFTFRMTPNRMTASEEGQISLYIFNYDDNYDRGLTTINNIRNDIIDVLLESYSGYWTGDITDDRDTTFKNIGEPYNGLPPFFCSRLDIPFVVPVTDRR